VVVHLSVPVPPAQSIAEPAPAGSIASPARAGFVVSKAVGNAVVRNKVRRRLRHLVRDRLAGLPAGALLVVRALPAAAAAPATVLAADLDAALASARAPRRGQPSGPGAR
jgi:ribonuclease P protein component